MRKLLLSLLLLTGWISFGQGPPPPNGCDPFYALDPENDGVTAFNLPDLFAYVAVDAMIDHGWDISNYDIIAYATELDRDLEINAIPGPNYTNTNPYQQPIYLGFVYSGTGPELEYPDLMSMTCWVLTTVDSNADADFDGVINSAEDLSGNGSLNDDNTDNDVLFNFQDENDDNDGLLTIQEDYNGNGNPADDDTNANSVPDYLENAVVLGLAQNAVGSFMVSPNPSHGSITVNFGANQGTLTVYDVSGKQLQTIVVSSPTVEMTGLAAGMYLLKYESQHKSSVTKLIVM